MFFALKVLVTKAVLAESLKDLEYGRNERHAMFTEEFEIEDDVQEARTLNEIIHVYEEKRYLLKPSSYLLTVRFRQEDPDETPSVIRIELNDTIVYNALNNSKLNADIKDVEIQPPYMLHDNENMETISHDEWWKKLIAPASETGSCGLVIPQSMPSVTGESPWHADIYRFEAMHMDYVCGGSLISRRHVLTAAHCVTEYKSNVKTEEENLQIYLGKRHLYEHDKNLQIRGVNRIIVYPYYNDTYLKNNIAILELDHDVVITDFVRLVCLWEEDIGIDLISDRLGTRVGWLTNKRTYMSKYLQQARSPIVSSILCANDNLNYFSRHSSRHVFCVNITNGDDACLGSPVLAIIYDSEIFKVAHLLLKSTVSLFKVMFLAVMALVLKATLAENSSSCADYEPGQRYSRAVMSIMPILYPTGIVRRAKFKPRFEKKFNLTSRDTIIVAFKSTLGTKEMPDMKTIVERIKFKGMTIYDKYSKKKSVSCKINKHEEKPLVLQPPDDVDVVAHGKWFDKVNAAMGSCGTVQLQSLPNYGQSSYEGEWPWHVAIYRFLGMNIIYLCGGTLISRRHVLTAAHCVTEHKSNLKTKHYLQIYLGKHNMYKHENMQIKAVRDITIHPNYDNKRLLNDIAILELDQGAKISDYVRHVCLWEEDRSLDSILNRIGTIVGWDTDESGYFSENLIHVEIPVQSTNACVCVNFDYFSRFSSHNILCASTVNPSIGDLGGGMVFPKLGGNKNVIWQLRGVISAKTCKESCHRSEYIIFTDVAAYLDWIKWVVEYSY